MEAFLKRVNKTESCWLWTGGCSGDGYGACRYNGKITGAHRVSYILNNGAIPPNIVVRHTCDTPKCVNPAHLQLGTVQDNTNDKTNRNRQARGEKVNTAKLTKEQVIEIRQLYKEKKCSYAELGRLYSITAVNAGDIIKNKTWRHINDC